MKYSMEYIQRGLFLAVIITFLLLFGGPIALADETTYPITTIYRELTTNSEIKENFGTTGSAQINDPLVRLNPDLKNQVGSVYLKNKIQLSDDFYIEGFLRIGFKGKSKDGDGMSINFHTGDVDALGAKGEGLGVLNLPDAKALVLDTYKNPNDPAVPYAGVWETNSVGEKSILSNMPLFYPGVKYEDYLYTFQYTASNRQLNMKLKDSKGEALGPDGYSMNIPKEISEYSFSITGSTGEFSNEQEAKISIARVAQLKTNKPKVVKEYVDGNSIKLTLTDENGIHYPEGSVVKINNEVERTVDANSSIIINNSNQYNDPLSIKVTSYKLNKSNKLWAEISEATEYTITKPMELVIHPSEKNVYDNYTGEFITNYMLSKIPLEISTGLINFTYPNETTDKVNFVSNNEKTYGGSQLIPRASIPNNMNSTPGTIVEYNTKLKANITEGNFNEGLPSNEQIFKVKVYNLGAKPIAQIVKKDSFWDKDPENLVKDIIVLPGHTAKFEYVSTNNPPVDTSKEGLQYVEVRMTDIDEPTQTEVLQVPVMVIEDEIPTTGIVIGANDIESKPETFKNLTEEQQKVKILELAEAVAWDAATGLSNDITLSVESTTLPLNPEKGSYKATLKAVRGTEIVKKTISIDIVQSNQKVNVEFIDETGEALHDKITFDKEIGTTIDLTEETEVQQVLESIQEKNYQLVKKPDNEAAIPVTSEESTVQYQFKGMLFVQSSPTFLSFGRKTLGIPFIKVEKAKYDKPLIVWDNRKTGGAWDLTATLKKPLTSQEDSSKILPSAIRYKVSETETVILSENVTQPIAEREHETKGQYNVSNEWDKNESGLLLEVSSGEVLQAGGYRATILWQVEQTP